MNNTEIQAKVLRAIEPGEIERAVDAAVELLKAGDVVALPTETVYGLAANALNPDAVAKIFAVKGRPSNNPLIVHVSSVYMAKRCVRQWSGEAQKLANNFWPGPLTIVLPKSEIIPPVVTAGGETVGVRFPSHSVIQKIIEKCGFPLAAPSANISNRVSPTTAEHVLRQLGNRIKLIVDGGACHVGIESTVFDVASNPPRVLRPGIIHEESLFAALGKKPSREQFEERENRTLRSPGLFKKHYAPIARLVCVEWRSQQELIAKLTELGALPEFTRILAYSNLPEDLRRWKTILMPKKALAYARALYAELHRCDEEGVKWIIVQTPPEQTQWDAIHDRLKRASAT
ncbi:MAG: L-threonylcarbamoyladenylate synthase [Verrucomicrobiae bacterium]|nr:L-threonylcarbamoyladenylate synthase [Verrucomicrobiae bacterium]